MGGVKRLALAAVVVTLFIARPASADGGCGAPSVIGDGFLTLASVPFAVAAAITASVSSEAELLVGIGLSDGYYRPFSRNGKRYSDKHAGIGTGFVTTALGSGLTLSFLQFNSIIDVFDLSASRACNVNANATLGVLLGYQLVATPSLQLTVAAGGAVGLGYDNDWVMGGPAAQVRFVSEPWVGLRAEARLDYQPLSARAVGRSRRFIQWVRFTGAVGWKFNRVTPTLAVIGGLSQAWEGGVPVIFPDGSSLERGALRSRLWIGGELGVAIRFGLDD